jgi:hypothetical protein
MIEPSLNKGPDFNKPGFEQVKDLYEKRKEDYNKNHIENVPDKEVVKEVIDDIFDKELNNKPVLETNPNISKFSVFDSNDNDDERRANLFLDGLVETAFGQGIHKAVDMSFRTSNAYLIDRFHDIIVDKFYEELVRQKKLKNN